MTCVRVGNAILTIADTSEPFFYAGRRWAVDKLWGPYPCNKYGDPSNSRVAAKHYDGAFNEWKRLFPDQAADWQPKN